MHNKYKNIKKYTDEQSKYEFRSEISVGNKLFPISPTNGTAAKV